MCWRGGTPASGYGWEIKWGGVFDDVEQGREIRLMQSEIKTDDKTGKPFLIVYYNPDRRDWDQRIAEAVKRYGIDTGTINIMAKPKKAGGGYLKNQPREK